ncbi:hypothetical protein [Tissierella praeacuta]|uniref:hypothetical protein n=1 Tax=Tissierella praeacuta TaxID=43131 RepID=UPI00333FDB76
MFFVELFLKNFTLLTVFVCFLSILFTSSNNKKINSGIFLFPAIFIFVGCCISIFELTTISETQKTVLLDIRNNYKSYEPIVLIFSSTIYGFVATKFVIKNNSKS